LLAVNRPYSASHINLLSDPKLRTVLIIVFCFEQFVSVSIFALSGSELSEPPGRGWWHWIVFDIPATVRALPQDAGAASGQNKPQGARQATNDFGQRGYGGPCPPPGMTHRYVFTVYALDAVSFPRAPKGLPARVAILLNFHAFAEASFTVYYGR
jgi:Raf kinase inhibitor-like YbhB/YbcL family protein